MGRRGEGYGSEDHFIRYRGERPEELDDYIIRTLPNPGRIDWLYPADAATREQKEPKDLAFMPLSETQVRRWHEFWPHPGNRRWDGIARCDSDWLLFEAKANETELCTPGTGASRESLHKILKAFAEVKNYLGVPQEAVWRQDYFQQANRIAVLYFLNVVVKIPARLIFLYFTGDAFPDGRPCPQNERAWRPLIGKCHAHLRLPEVHPLSDRMHEVFIPVRGLKGILR